MITMLCRFDLDPDVAPSMFCDQYREFEKRLIELGLIQSGSGLGTRISDTPMDTDVASAPRYYSLMHFKDRRQLDNSYDVFAGRTALEAPFEEHQAIKSATTSQIFTCWEAPDN